MFKAIVQREKIFRENWEFLACRPQQTAWSSPSTPRLMSNKNKQVGNYEPKMVWKLIIMTAMDTLWKRKDTPVHN